MLASDRDTMEGPPAVTAGGLEFRRVNEFTFPCSGQLMYSVHGASNNVHESAPLTLALTGDEGDAGENIQVAVGGSGATGAGHLNPHRNEGGKSAKPVAVLPPNVSNFRLTLTAGSQGQAEIRERLARLEGLLEGLREAITGRPVAQ